MPSLHFKQSEYNQGWQWFFHSHIMWSAADMLIRSLLKVNMLETPSHNLCLPSNGDIYAILLFLSQLCQPVRRSATSVCSVGVVMVNITVGVAAPPAATLPSLHPCCRFSCSQSATRAFFLSATAAAAGPLLCCCCCPSPTAVCWLFDALLLLAASLLLLNVPLLLPLCCCLCLSVWHCHSWALQMLLLRV